MAETDPTKSDFKEDLIQIIESREDIQGRFTKIRRIDKDAGNGNFSLVFKAIDDKSKRHREVVLKFMNPLIEEYRKECFSREAKILEDLQGQRNILPLIQKMSALNIPLNDSVTGRTFPIVIPFYVSYLAEYNISQYIYEKGPNYKTNIIIFREICKAVQRIHRHKVSDQLLS